MRSLFSTAFTLFSSMMGSDSAPAAAAPSSTALPPVRPPAVPQKLQKSTPGAPKQLTKQQINQIAAREKQKAEAARKAALAASGITPLPTSGKQDKKRKKPAADSDSDSDSGSDDDEPMAKAIKASAAATPASAAAAGAASSRVDTTGMDPKAAKQAVIEAKKAARALKKQKTRSIAEAAGTHPTQNDIQLMNRDNQAVQLWKMYQQDRKERDQEMTPIELDDELVGRCLASIPNHESPDSHSFKLLYKHLKSMYGGNYAEQVLGGTIQPALSTKAERFAEKREKSKLTEEEAEEAEDEEVRQKQQHIDDPTIGAPYIIFVTHSALRAVEIGRGFKQIPMNTRIVKLFAKHLKVEQQREELSHDVRVCIGTPHRLLKLSQSGFLKWNRARLIVWDIGKTRKLQVAEQQERRRRQNKIKAGIHVENAHIIDVRPDEKGKDRKMFTLLTLRDTKSELWKLYEQFMHQVVVNKQSAKIVLL